MMEHCARQSAVVGYAQTNICSYGDPFRASKYATRKQVEQQAEVMSDTQGVCVGVGCWGV